MNWGEDALFAWEEDLAREDKDFDFIKYYKNVDQHKYNVIFKIVYKKKKLHLSLLKFLFKNPSYIYCKISRNLNIKGNLHNLN